MIDTSCTCFCYYRLEESDFNGQLIGGKMEIRLEKLTLNDFKAYRWKKWKPRRGVLK